MTKRPCVYILASRRNGALYVGVTADLIKRIWEHKNDAADGFTKKYGSSYACMVRAARNDGIGHYARESHQRMEAALETRIDREL